MKVILTQAKQGIKNQWGNKATENDKKILDLAQNGWIQYRDNQCRYKTPNKSGEPASHSFKVELCLVEKTIARIDELKATYLNKGE